MKNELLGSFRSAFGGGCDCERPLGQRLFYLLSFLEILLPTTNQTTSCIDDVVYECCIYVCIPFRDCDYRSFGYLTKDPFSRMYIHGHTCMQSSASCNDDEIFIRNGNDQSLQCGTIVLIGNALFPFDHIDCSRVKGRMIM